PAGLQPLPASARFRPQGQSHARSLARLWLHRHRGCNAGHAQSDRRRRLGDFCGRQLRGGRCDEPGRRCSQLHCGRDGGDLAAHHGGRDILHPLQVEVEMMAAFDILLTASFWVAAIRIASPLIFATMGELICERAGVLNLGIEGIMVAGAFAGWLTVYLGGDLWFGVVVAALAGAAFGLLHGTLTVPLGLSQHVVGLGVTLLATATAAFAYRLSLPEVTSPPKIVPFQPLPVPGLSELPLIGPAFFAQTPLTYLAFV